jgi:nitroimidazol reductase NimA-like FMN-containing flavoprotein (pyridoxamine 5'-phosphate oxidase superfamily)
MLITRLRSKECRETLSRLGFGRLACSSNDRPYIVPIYFHLDADRLYSFSTLGQKILWMRQNPLVCLEADDIRSHDDWESVVVLGRYVEIETGPAGAKARNHVRSLLQKRPLWWQSGYTATQVRRQPKQASPIYYCILIEKMTGLRGSPDISEAGKRPGIKRS